MIWELRLKRLEECYLAKWPSFTIWNAGKQGRRLYRSLSEDSRRKVASFCDVDTKKIRQAVYIYEDSTMRPKPRVPIVHFTDGKPPFVICVKLVITIWKEMIGNSLIDLYSFVLKGFNQRRIREQFKVTQFDWKCWLCHVQLREN